MTTPAAPVSMYVDLAGLPWIERRPGVFWKFLWEDPDGRHKAILMRYEPGAVVPRHRHIGDEQIYVLEGSVSDDTGTCRAGGYARPAARLRAHGEERGRRARPGHHLGPDGARMSAGNPLAARRPLR